ncbi:MAG: transcription elongation factor GreA [Syntrophobacteraceae bacterium]|nr:transcription elongation factor GreA [Syntrophobacteraceae bacterium]
MKPKVPITRYGHRKLRQELSHLRRVVRPEVLDDLCEARGYGVKVENQQYLLARERHATMLKKINDLEEKLATCEIFVGRKFFIKRVSFGAVITVQNLHSGEVNRFQMVGPWESDISDGRLSVDSPVGKGLMGRGEGEEVMVTTPSGDRSYRILSIEL